MTKRHFFFFFLVLFLLPAVSPAQSECNLHLSSDFDTVMGIAPEEVAEITVLTMQGGQVADFRNVYRFSVSGLATASYIVRVVTTEGKVHYLKMVKQ